MNYVVSYWGKEDDREHVVFCESKEEATQKAKAVEGLAEEAVSIMTREEYDEFELMVLDMEA